MFHVGDLDDPGSIRAAAGALGGTASTVNTEMDATNQTFSPITGQYEAPESPMLQTAFSTPLTSAGELTDAGDQAEAALRLYAADLEDLEGRRRTLVAEIGQFNAEGAEGADDDDRGAHEELKQRCHNSAGAKDQAQNTCVAALSAITTSASQQRSSAPHADEAGDAESHHEAQHGNTWDHVEDGVEGLQVPHTGVGLGLNSVHYAVTTPRARQNWLPQSLQNVAAKGGRQASLVEKTTGWSANSVTNGGHWMKATDAANPYALAAPPNSAKNVARNLNPKDLTRRTLANLNDNNTVAKAGQSSTASRLSTAGRWMNVGGGVLTAVGSGLNSVKNDMANHPDMSGTEMGARAVTQGGVAAAGGWAGAKGGAALGAAVGTAFGPAGTVVGGLVGGVVGGVAGSAAGQAFGEAIKEPAGKIADSVKEAGKDLWAGAKSLFGS